MAAMAATVILAGGCGSTRPSPPPVTTASSETAPRSAPIESDVLGLSRAEAISVAREAAAGVNSWLGDAPVSFARRDRFADVREPFAPQVSPPPPDDLIVWTIRLFDEHSGQGTVVIVDAVDGRVLQVVTFIT